MKVCPHCQNKYTDETLKYCLQDGSELVGISIDDDSSPTHSFEETPTVISTNKAEQISFDLSDSQKTDWDESQVTRVSTLQSEPKSSKTLLAVLTTMFVMFLLFSLIGVGAYFYLSQDSKELAENRNNKEKENLIDNSLNGQPENNDETADDLKTPEPEKTAKPTPTKTQGPTATPTKTPDDKGEETRKDVQNTIYRWKSLAEARNLVAYMNNYASKLHYYKKKGASKSFVFKDKQKAFRKYDSIKSTISNMKITPSIDGNSAVAVFDKEWLFTGPSTSTSGKVRSQLKFKKVGDKWLITSERDLRVYYVNK